MSFGQIQIQSCLLLTSDKAVIGSPIIILFHVMSKKFFVGSLLSKLLTCPFHQLQPLKPNLTSRIYNLAYDGLSKT